MDFVIVFLYGIFVGCMTGMLGAGGGTLIVPFLHLYLGLPIKTAIGTSLFQVSGIAASGASQHYRFGSTDLKLALILIISGSSMAFVGAKFAKLVPDNALKLVFGIFVVIVALKFMKSKSKEGASGDSVKNKVKVNSPVYNILHNPGNVSKNLLSKSWMFSYNILHRLGINPAHILHRLVNIPHAAIGLLLIISGAKFTNIVPDEILMVLLAILVIIVVAKLMEFRSKKKDSEPLVGNETEVSQINGQNYNMFHNLGKFLHVSMVSPVPMYMHRKTKIAEYTIHIPKVFLLGGIVGFSSGVLGVGGGFLLVPGLAFLGIPLKIAVGTDLTQIIASASVGTATYFPDGYVDLAVGSLLMVGGVIGTFIGTRLNKKLPASVLKKSFGILMLFVGALMIAKAVL